MLATVAACGLVAGCGERVSMPRESLSEVPAVVSRCGCGFDEGEHIKIASGVAGGCFALLESCQAVLADHQCVEGVSH